MSVVDADEIVYGFKAKLDGVVYGGARRFPGDVDGSDAVVAFLHGVQKLADRLALPAWWAHVPVDQVDADPETWQWVKVCPRPGFWDGLTERMLRETADEDKTVNRRATLWIARLFERS